MKRGAVEISFGWLFAIIVGVFILFMAILLVTRIINVEQEVTGAKTGEEIGILLNPLETSFATAKSSSFGLPVETRIHNTCDEGGSFGKQKINIEQKSFNKWRQTNLNATFENKYIFSNKEIEGKEFYVFSKAFEFPFKVADLIYMSSAKEEYCFFHVPIDIEEELMDLGQENLVLEGNCSENSIDVCFSSGNCDIQVSYSRGYVKKGSEELYFEGDALMYAAVFSDKEVYECQLKRLMKRLGELAFLYNEKGYVIEEGCEFDFSTELIELGNSAKNLDSSSYLANVKGDADVVETKNNLADCMLW